MEITFMMISQNNSKLSNSWPTKIKNININEENFRTHLKYSIKNWQAAKKDINNWPKIQIRESNK